MRDRDAALDQAIQEVATILGNALVRLLFPDSSTPGLDLSEAESPDGTAG